jgi:hypothetical protein
MGHFALIGGLAASGSLSTGLIALQNGKAGKVPLTSSGASSGQRERRIVARSEMLLGSGRLNA